MKGLSELKKLQRSQVIPRHPAKMFKLAALASLVTLLPLIKAQQSVWGQCKYIH